MSITDVIVVGGGPAGLLAAGRAVELCNMWDKNKKELIL